MRKDKKAQAQGAIGAVIALVVGVGVAVLILVFVGVLGGQAYDIAEDDIDSIATNTVTGEASVVTNATSNLAHGFIQEGTLHIYNTTTPFHEWGLDNFTIDYDAGQIVSLPLGSDYTVPLNSTTLFANYTWGAKDVRDSVKNSIVSGFEALENTGDYIPLIVLGIVIFIVLGLVLGMTAFSMGGRGGSAL